MKKKREKRGALIGGLRGQNCRFHHLTAYEWEFGRSDVEGINQNFYGTEENSKNFMVSKESI